MEWDHYSGLPSVDAYKMTKIVINRDHGGFGLSDLAIKRYFELKGWGLVPQDSVYGTTNFYRDTVSEETFFNEYDLERNDPVLVQVVEELGEKANTRFSSLRVVDIPADVHWYIEEYDGAEHVAEYHRTWR